jgi:hypothetical protein
MPIFTLPAPRFEKRVHHVVPASWQRRFAGPAGIAFYKNVKTGRNSGPEGPGNKMSAEYANIVFDKFYRPSDMIENVLGEIETISLRAIDRVLNTRTVAKSERIDIAYFLAIQACRYPDRFPHRLDLAKLLVLSFGSVTRFTDAANFNSWLKISGLLPGAEITSDEFEQLRSLPEEGLSASVDSILKRYGYEADFNIELVLSGALPIAEHLVSLNWELLEVRKPEFVLSDRPVPIQDMGYAFSVPLAASFALVFIKPESVVNERDIVARNAAKTEVDAINNEQRARAQEWICGPDQVVWQL